MTKVKPMSTKNSKPIVRDGKKLVRNQEEILKKRTVRPARSVIRVTK